VKTGRPDIADVLDHYGVSGRRRMVPCPLHVDLTPSCSINYDTHVFNCHSCGMAGDSWTLIMLKEGISKTKFYDAVKFAQKTGLDVGASDDGEEVVTGSAYGGSRAATKKSKNAPGNSYKPSWRR